MERVWTGSQQRRQGGTASGGDEDQRTQSVLEAGTQGGGSELVKLNSANTSGGFKAIGDVDKSSLHAGGA